MHNNNKTDKGVYDALVEGIPDCVMIQVRRWQYKETLTGSSLPIDVGNAYTCGNSSEASQARTGIHNDCFLGSETDFGTWKDSTVDRPRMSAHSKYTIFGGETCNTSSNRNNCSMAVEELSLFHFTYLNNNYHPDVLALWRQNGCHNTIAKRLGYRLVLVSSIFPDQAARGDDMTFEITIRNDGFAAPMTESVVKLVWQKGTGQQFFRLTNDPRVWLGNGMEHVISGQMRIPSEIEVGEWSIYLAIVDAAPSLKAISQYNILAVNQMNTVQQSLGLNDLQRSIMINGKCISYP